MTRRAHGEGTIRQRRPGQWEARYVAADGRRRSLYAETRRDVVAALRDALRDAQHGILPIGRQMTVGEWLDAWLDAITVRPGTRRSYRETCDRYIRPSIGKVRLAQLQPEHVGRMIGSIRDAHPKLSPTTVRYSYVVLRIALGRAVKTGRVQRNVCILIDPPPKVRHEVVPMSADEARTFLRATTGTPREPLYRLAVTTGMRMGELLGLRWVDVDLDDRTITIRHALTHGVLSEPKTERARRTIGIEEGTAVVLRTHKARQARDRLAAGTRWRGAASPDEDWVFGSHMGEPLIPRTVGVVYHRDLAAAGLRRLRFHDLRHGAATLLLEHGEELANVSRLLGHSSLATTADFYAHLTPTTTRRAADRMRDILAG